MSKSERPLDTNSQNDNESDANVDGPTLAKNKQFIDYWFMKAADDQLDYKSFLPEDLPNQLWRNLFITEITYNPFQVKLIYQGLFITEELGQYFIGSVLDESIFGENASDIISLYQQTCDNKRPVVSQEEMTANTGLQTIIEVLHTPLFDPAGNVSHVVGTIDRLCSTGPLDGVRAIPKQWNIEKISEVD